MSLPDPAKIPATAYLLVGYTPGEEKAGGRFTGDEADFYFLSDENISKPNDHFFKINFNIEDQLKELSTKYKEKFTIVILDYAVVDKFLKIKDLTHLFNIVKNDGYLILDNNTPVDFAYNTKTSKENNEKRKLSEINEYKKRIEDTFKDYLTEHIQYKDTNPKSTRFEGNIKDILTRVYWPRVYIGKDRKDEVEAKIQEEKDKLKAEGKDIPSDDFLTSRITRSLYPISWTSEFVLIQKKLKKSSTSTNCVLLGGRKRKRHLSRKKLIKKRTKTSRRRCAQ